MSDTHSLLNELIETTLDGERGFTRAAEDVQEVGLRTIFTECAGRCRNGAAELQMLVRSMGETAKNEGTVKAAVHRGWMDLKTKFTSRDALAVLEEVERGEDYAKARYAQALKLDLPANLRGVIQRQYDGVVANHDRIRDLRNQYRDQRKSA